MEHEINTWAMIVASIFIITGVVGTLLPIIPGVVIVWFGILIYKLWDPAGISWTLVFVCGGLAILAQILDFVCSYYGARRFGATWRGGVGALLGAIFGPFLLGPVITPIGGLIVGPIAGAVVGELSAGRTAKESGKAGVGTVVGGIVSALLKMVIAVFMAGWFYLESF
ncbi:DUF456 domain-containing protein [Rubellicoccus peritrichatus]|uniref:DUF456 domain-containing protein n=1 Tax=Rubellicoccus peritrichatus TaxID=3080537 RepID=A0AAQ3LC28_9BACT|nr:DUF456 domain-containing protein [Puniceicoccus sp. CR14]WOO41814.1 DUF456 domain-containing protein [Puniceicoccus sp. CR14]